MNWNKFKNFSEWEFSCDYTDLNDMDEGFISLLQQIRSVYSRPMIINSGYRHWTHPIERAKNRPGEHSLGLAADIAVSGINNVVDLLVISHAHGIKRIGVYQSKEGHFLHLGIGDREHNYPHAIWTT